MSMHGVEVFEASQLCKRERRANRPMKHVELIPAVFISCVIKEETSDRPIQMYLLVVRDVRQKSSST